MMELPSTLTARDGTALDRNARGQYGDIIFGMIARLAMSLIHISEPTRP